MAKRVVLITGAGIGIGRATAIAFADAGSHVVVTDVLESEGNAVVETIRSQGRQRRFPAPRCHRHGGGKCGRGRN